MSPTPSYDELRSSFRWQLPAVVNIGVEVSDRQPQAAPAILVTDGREITRTVSFGELTEASNRLANALVAKGVAAGDRVALILSQRPETVIAHVAIYKLGAIVVPLSAAFGSDALGVRLRGSEPRAIIAERASLERATELGFDGILIDVDHDLDAMLAAASPDFTAAATTPDTPALLVYTSGTTGSPKGALHGHRVLAGHLPGFELSHDFFPQPGDRIWTPADWAWIGGLYDVVMPGLAHGIPVVAFRTPRFDPEVAFDVIARAGIRNVFMPATALRMMRRSDGVPVTLRTIASGGETVGEETAAWCRERFGVRLNEFYGQTEANLLIGNCAAWPERPGWMGRAYPGHELRLVEGEIAVKVAGDPVVFLGYWRDEAATTAKVRDGWLHTGDLAEVDDEGNYRSIGRVDDLISSAGHRIGPGEIEECLIRHPSVSIAAVIGVPDAIRGELVKAFVVTNAGTVGSPELVAELQQLVRTRLAPYEVPREIEFVDELPLTVTGKIRRAELRDRGRLSRPATARSAPRAAARLSSRSFAVELDDPVAGSRLHELGPLVGGAELEPGGGRRHDGCRAHAMAGLVVHVAAADEPDPLVAEDQILQLLASREADPVHPGEAEEDRWVMHEEDDGGRVVLLELRLDPLDLVGADVPRDQARHVRVETDAERVAGSERERDPLGAVAVDPVGERRRRMARSSWFPGTNQTRSLQGCRISRTAS